MRKSYFDLDDYPVILSDTKIHAHFMRGLIFFLIALFIILMLTSCAIVTFEGAPDGSTKVNIYSLGTDKILEDFKASINKAGDRKLSIGSFDANQTEGMRQVNEGMKMIVKGAAKGAVAGAK